MNLLQKKNFNIITGFQNTNLFCILSGILLGITTFLIIYGTYPLDVTNDSWLMVTYVEDDLSQHYAGWLLFRQSPWTWPPGFASELAYPLGSSISFTDSLPFVSILFKLLDPILPETFQFFGIWVLFCFILQGIASCLLISLFTDNRIIIPMISVFFLTYPILVERAFRHSALTAQWYILFALYLYFKSRRGNQCFKWQFLLLNFTVSGIHPYFMPMTLGFLLLSLVEYAVKNKKLWKPLIVFFTNFLLVILSCLIVGVFSIGVSDFKAGEASAGGYGYVSMNLNALYNPVSAGNIKWSSLLPVLPQIRGNYDGFNYLGLGVIAAAILALILFCRDFKKHKNTCTSFLKRNSPLLAVCIFLFLFAITNAPTFNDKLLWEIPLPEWFENLASIFRSSGRMFYPVSYLILLFSLICILKKYHGKIGILLISALLIFQIADIYPALKAKHEVFQQYSQTELKSSFDNPLWNSLTEEYDSVIFMEKPVSNSRFSAYMTKRGVRSNVNPSTRMDYDAAMRYIGKIEDGMRNGIYNKNALYVFKTEEKLQQISSIIPCDKIAIQYYYYYVLIPVHNGYTLPENAQEYYSII